MVYEPYDPTLVKFGVWLNRVEYPHAKVPLKAHTFDAGFDLFSADEMYMLEPGERRVFHTGIHLKMADGWEAQIRPRSGNAAKSGITVTNSPGTVDSSYTGEVMVILQNTDTENYFQVNTGDKIAQMVFKRVPIVGLYELNEKPSNEDRGESGFGSTGV